MGEISLKGIIIKIVNYKDYDRYLNILTKEFGIISVYAKGIRRQKNRFNSLCQLFNFNEFILFENKGRYSLREVSNIHTFSVIKSDLYLLSVAAQISELIMDNIKDISNSYFIYELFIRTIYMLDKYDATTKKIAFTSSLRLTSYIGHEPLINGCFICGRDTINDQISYFDFHGANIYCQQDIKKIDKEIYSNTRQISLNLLRTLRYIFSADITRLFSYNIDEKTELDLEKFCNTYLEERYDKDYNKISKLDNFIFK